MKKPIAIKCLVVLAAALVSTPALARRGRGISDLTKDGRPNIQSASTLVIDFKDNTVLFEKDADTVRPLASISKIVAALVIHEECGLKPDDLHIMSVANREAARGGDKTKLTTGWSYSHRDLMHAALMRSDNRALPALGEACGVDPTKLGERMTERVRRMGLTKTFFREPTGLSPENVSTAREIMIFLREVVKVQELAEIMSTVEYTITAHKDGRTRPLKIRSTDRLLTKNVATIVGGKTGYTDLARYCFAVAAKTNEGREFGAVFLGAEGRHTRFADFTRVVRWLAPTQATIAKDDGRHQPVKEQLHAPALVKAAGVGAATLSAPAPVAPKATAKASTKPEDAPGATPATISPGTTDAKLDGNADAETQTLKW